MAKLRNDRADRSVREGTLKRAKPITQVVGVSLLTMGVFVGLAFYLDRDKEEPDTSRALASYTVEDAQSTLVKLSKIADGKSVKSSDEGVNEDDMVVKNASVAKIPSSMPKPPKKETLPTLVEIQKARVWAHQMVVTSGNLSFSGGKAKEVDVDVEMFNRLPVNEQNTLINQVHGSIRDAILRNISYKRRSTLQPPEPDSIPDVTTFPASDRVATYLSTVQSIEQKRLDSTLASGVIKDMASLTPPEDCLSFHALYASFLNAKARGADETTLKQQSRALEAALQAIQQSHTNLSEDMRSLRITP